MLCFLLPQAVQQGEGTACVTLEDTGNFLKIINKDKHCYKIIIHAAVQSFLVADLSELDRSLSILFYCLITK